MAPDDPSGGDERPDPRFSLANERTLLAWNRTALALVAGGLAAVELLAEPNRSPAQRALGAALIAVGGFVAWAGFRRWRAVERSIAAGEWLPPTSLPTVLTAAVVGAALVAVVMAAT